MNILKFIKGAIVREEKETEGSHSRERIVDEVQTQLYLNDPEFPRLVSFSRTGSHWLRMLMELYFEKPSLRLLFFQTVAQTKTYTCYHTHDLELTIEAENVIYLYRDPVDTIYSQMSFHDQDINDLALLDGWIELYARHMHKWLTEEKFTKKKVILSYEGMRKNLEGEFRKLATFFNVPFNSEKLKNVGGQVSKEKIQEKTAHDPRVIKLGAEYGATREKFRELHADRIYKTTFSMFPELSSYFESHGNI